MYKPSKNNEPQTYELGSVQPKTLRAEVENKSKFPLHMECLVLF